MAAIERSPFKVLHVGIIAACAFGFAVDLLELALGGAMSGVFSASPYHLDAGTLSTLLISVYVGAIIGAPIFGMLADKIGPKKILSIAVAWFGLMSLLTAACGNFTELTIVRFLAGIALGAYPPVMIAYLTDIAPIHRRGPVIFSTCALAYLAPPLAIFAMRWLTPIAPFGIEGWRWPFALAGLVSVATSIGYLFAPEAPHWLQATGRTEKLRQVADRIARSSPIRILNLNTVSRPDQASPTQRRAAKC